MNAIVPGDGFLYLTKWGKASSLQKDRETKRTPAGVAGGRLVISWRSCSASSSVGLQREAISNTWSVSTPLSFTETKASVKRSEDLPHSAEPTWDQQYPWEHSRVWAGRWPSLHAPPWGPSTPSLLPYRRHWGRVCCASVAGWPPALAAAVGASATTPSCFPSFSESPERHDREGKTHVSCCTSLTKVRGIAKNTAGHHTLIISSSLATANFYHFQFIWWLKLRSKPVKW